MCSVPRAVRGAGRLRSQELVDQVELPVAVALQNLHLAIEVDHPLLAGAVRGPGWGITCGRGAGRGEGEPILADHPTDRPVLGAPERSLKQVGHFGAVVGAEQLQEGPARAEGELIAERLMSRRRMRAGNETG